MGAERVPVAGKLSQARDTLRGFNDRRAPRGSGATRGWPRARPRFPGQVTPKDPQWQGTRGVRQFLVP